MAHRGVRLDGALRRAGRPAREQDRRIRARIDRRERSVGPADQVADRHRRQAPGHDARDCLVDPADEAEVRPHELELVGELGGQEELVERHGHAAGPEDPEVGGQVGRVVRAEDAHAVARP